MSAESSPHPVYVHLLGFLENMAEDHDEAHGRAYMAGFEQAIHYTRDLYLAMSAECGCDFASPEAYKNGEWGCADCGELLLAADESDEDVDWREE